MSNYRKIAEEALRKAALGSKPKIINESILYPDGLKERMHPQLEKDLSAQKHSLGKHPIFPEGDETSFEEKIMGERFKDVVTRYKRAFDVGDIDTKDVISQSLPMVKDVMSLEASHRKKLEKLAIDMVREEYDIDEETLEIHAELVDRISLEGTKKEPKPVTAKMEFDTHDDIVQANKEVYKRRFLNAMIQGAAKKCNHMFHMKDDELADMDPRLPNKYSKLMSSADYMYYVFPNLENGTPGGIVKVQFPSEKNPKAVIYAQAIVFPVLIHELVKGVMEILSAHGLPKDKKMGKFVIDKADFLAAEPWDMRLGPALWQRFTECIDPSDFPLKHHIYSDLASLPVDEFNIKMREIMAGTKQGKEIISNLVEEIKTDLQRDEFEIAMGGSTNDAEGDIEEENDSFDYDELMGSESDALFDFDELMGSDDGEPESFDFEDLI